VAEAAHRCLFLSDYFNFLLSGRMENEVSVASHSQLLSVHDLDWAPEVMARFGVPRRWFSKPLTSPRQLGPVRGLPPLRHATAVLVPGHDTACAFAAMPAATDGSDLYLSAGTWSLIGFESDNPVLGSEALKARVSNERMGNGRFRPLHSCVGLWLVEQILVSFTARPKNASQWRELISASKRSSPPSVTIDLADKALFNPTNMRQAIDSNILRRGGCPPRTLPEYVRLISLSLGEGHAAAAHRFESLAGRKFNRILMVGGGSKNPLLCQDTAGASGLPVYSLELEGSAVGNLASQLIALGAVRDLAAFRACLARSLRLKCHPPDMAS
jgi:rhamnulokinase